MMYCVFGILAQCCQISVGESVTELKKCLNEVGNLPTIEQYYSYNCWFKLRYSILVHCTVCPSGVPVAALLSKCVAVAPSVHFLLY